METNDTPPATVNSELLAASKAVWTAWRGSNGFAFTRYMDELEKAIARASATPPASPAPAAPPATDSPASKSVAPATPAAGTQTIAEYADHIPRVRVVKEKVDPAAGREDKGMSAYWLALEAKVAELEKERDEWRQQAATLSQNFQSMVAERDAALSRTSTAPAPEQDGMRKAIEAAMDYANNRWDEWGDRAIAVRDILRTALDSTPATATAKDGMPSEAEREDWLKTYTTNSSFEKVIQTAVRAYDNYLRTRAASEQGGQRQGQDTPGDGEGAKK